MRTPDKKAFAEHVVELMHHWAFVQAKAMFGGFGVYREGVMFALLADEMLYFKADAQSQGAFTQLGLAPFTYQTGDKVATLHYYAAPAQVYDAPEQMAHWAQLAWQSALRQQKNKRPATPKAVKRRHAQADDSLNLLNLGDKSEQMLKKAGISTFEHLKSLGAVRAYVQVKAVWPKASLNLLWALEGAISERHWQDVARADRASLLMALEDAMRRIDVQQVV